ncbi:MAG: TGS domain-containing protein [Chloroflexi bacterium]|jgi:sulfur carrier protein ThiS|nr:TGS domain-containing protein [Chloroflexota bacterium]
MVVTVHLHTILQRQTPDGMQQQLDVMLLSGSKVGDLVHDLGLGLPVEAIEWKVNGRLVTADRILQDGDQVHLIAANSKR